MAAVRTSIMGYSGYRAAGIAQVQWVAVAWWLPIRIILGGCKGFVADRSVPMGCTYGMADGSQYLLWVAPGLWLLFASRSPAQTHISGFH